MLEYIMSIIICPFRLLYESSEISDYRHLYFFIAIYLLIRIVSLIIENSLVSKKFNFKILSFKVISLNLLWDIVYNVMLTIIVLISMVVCGSIVVGAVISIILYVFLWIKEAQLVLPLIFKQMEEFKYITDSKLNLFIMSSIHRIILLTLLLSSNGFKW